MPDTRANGPAAGTLVVVALLVVALLIALAPRWWGGGGRGERMRRGLAEAMLACRTAYDSASTAADTRRVDALVPPLNGAVDSANPTCGAYREKRMFR